MAMYEVNYLAPQESRFRPQDKFAIAPVWLIAPLNLSALLSSGATLPIVDQTSVGEGTVALGGSL